MATTTNYAWETPDDTDLVKDGAAAIRTLGSSIDTTTKALNPSTTLGDIEYRSATANTNTRLGIGTTGQVLAVSGGVPAWTTPAGSGSNFVALNGAGTSLSGSSTSITGLSGYDKYYVYIYNMSGSTGTPGFNMTFNSDTSSKYGGDALQLNANSTAINIVGITFTGINGDTSFPLGFAAAASSLNATMMITGGNSSGAKIVERQAGVGSTSGNSVLIQTGIYTGTSVISSIQITCSTGTFDAGTVYIYGSA